MENCAILAQVLHFSCIMVQTGSKRYPAGGSTVCSHAAPLAYRLIRANTVRPYDFACSNRLITKNPSQREGFQSVKKVRLAYCVSCDSTHKIEFAKQIHKFREHVSRNLYKGRKNVPVGRGFSSVFARKRGFEREAARKTIVFRQPQKEVCPADLFFLFTSPA